MAKNLRLDTRPSNEAERGDEVAAEALPNGKTGLVRELDANRSDTDLLAFQQCNRRKQVSKLWRE